VIVDSSTPPYDEERRWSVDAHLAQITVYQTQRVTIIRVDGEMDVSNTVTVHSVVADAVGAADSGLVIDLSGVGFIDSSSVSLVLKVSNELGQRRRSFQVVAPRGCHVRRVLEMMGLAGEAIAENLESALTDKP
jgi:anti-anti-sigma factor